MADDKKFTEDAYEQTLIALFRDELGYAYECGTMWNATSRSLSIVPIWLPLCDDSIPNCQPI